MEFEFKYKSDISGFFVDGLSVEEAARSLVEITQKSTGTVHKVQEWIDNKIPLALAGQLI